MWGAGGWVEKGPPGAGHAGSPAKGRRRVAAPWRPGAGPGAGLNERGGARLAAQAEGAGLEEKGGV